MTTVKLLKIYALSFTINSPVVIQGERSHALVKLTSLQTTSSITCLAYLIYFGNLTSLQIVSRSAGCFQEGKGWVLLRLGMQRLKSM